VRIQQRFSFLLIGVIIIGIGFTVGIGQFSTNNVQTNKVGITVRLSTIAANIFEFQLRSFAERGRGKSFVGYNIPSELASDAYGRYIVDGSPGIAEIRLSGLSTFDPSWCATMTIDSTGNTSIQYSGWQ